MNAVQGVQQVQVQHHHNHSAGPLAPVDDVVSPSDEAPDAVPVVSNPIPTATPGGSTKQGPRLSLTLDQRRALRRWANSQTVRPSHRACIEWFSSQFHQSISQSTVSHSLSPKYARLDGDPQLSGSRLRYGNWPDVEKLVLLWHQQTVNAGRQPSNEDLAEKAKTIFQQLPRYREEAPPEFSPGWIHRFKKRYGLLIKRQRRSGAPSSLSMSGPEDIPYLIETVPKLTAVTPDVSPAAIRDVLSRVVGIDPPLATCSRVKDEILRRQENPPPPPPAGGHLTPLDQNGDIDMTGTAPAPPVDPTNGGDVGAVPPAPGSAVPAGGFDSTEDPEVVLQTALRAMQAQEEADAEGDPDRDAKNHPSQIYQAAAAAALLATPTPLPRPSRGDASMGPPAPPFGTPGPRHNGSATPGSAAPNPVAAPSPIGAPGANVTLTPIQADGPVAVNDRPIRCPFCVNQRMLRTIKEAVEHLSSHVVV